MKKLGKIFALLLTLSVLVGLFVLAVSASTETDPNANYQFRVGDDYYTDDWDDAVTAAAGTKTIYLNKDWAPTQGKNADGDPLVSATFLTTSIHTAPHWNAPTGFSITSSVKLDLNGKTVSMTDLEGVLFSIGANGTLELLGEGTFTDTGTLVSASGDTAKLIINAYGKGFDITTRVLNDKCSFTNTGAAYIGSMDLFVLYNKCTAEISGTIDIDIPGEGLSVFNADWYAYSVFHNQTLSGVDGAILFDENGIYTEDFASARTTRGAKSLTFDAARITANWQDRGDWGSKLELIAVDADNLDGGATELVIKNHSYLEVNDGILIKMLGTKGTQNLAPYMPTLSDTWTTLPTQFNDTKDEDMLCSITVSDSTLVSNAVASKTTMGQGIGSILTTWGSFVKASFTNVDMFCSGRPISCKDNLSTATPWNASTSDTDVLKTLTNLPINSVSRLEFTGCNLTMNPAVTVASQYVFVGNNIKWSGGSITGNSTTVSLTAGTFPYAETKNAWVGAKFEDVVFKDIKVASASWNGYADLNSNYGYNFWQPYSTFESTDSYLTHSMAMSWSDTPYSSVDRSQGYYKFTLNDASASDAFSCVVCGEPLLTAGISVCPNEACSAHTGTTAVYQCNTCKQYLKANTSHNKADGTACSGTKYTTYSNNYYELTTGGAGYNEIRLGSAAATISGTTISDSSVLHLADYRYVVQEFDVKLDAASASSYIKLTPQGRSIVATIDKATGAVTGGSAKYGPARSGLIYMYGDGRFVSGDINKQMNDAWNRVTMVWDISCVVASYDELVTAGILNSGWTEDQIANMPTFYNVGGTKCHIYLNGEFVSTNSLSVGTTYKYYHEDVIGTLTAIGERIYVPTGFKAGDSVCFDNTYVMGYSDTADIGLYQAGTTTPVTTLSGHHFNVMPDNNKAALTPVGSVDGVDYYTEKELVSAIEEGSYVVLNSDLSTPIAAGAKKITVNLNGHELAGIVSDTNKVLRYESGYYSVIKAEVDEVYTITFNYGEASAESQAALGTDIAAPESMLPENLAVALDEENKLYKQLTGWTLADGTTVVSKSESAVAVVLDIPAAVVEWTTADGATVIHSDYYNPTLENSFADFDGEDIKAAVVDNWSATRRVGWNEADLAAVDLTNGGTYKIKAVMGTIGYVGNIKLNLTLYSNFQLNIYIPDEGREEKNITSLKIATDAAGTKTLKQLTVDGGYLLDGELHEKYICNFGVANTDIIDFYIIYTMNGETYTYKIKYGIPSYARAVAEGNYSDVAKKLIVNVANYADKVLTLAEADKTTEGAKIYANILASLGQTYLGTYNGLVDERFAAEDDAATAGVTNDMYSDYIAKGTFNSENELAKYIKKIGFYFGTYEPAFVVEYSDEAIAYGIRKPDGSNNYIGYYKPGFMLYAKYGDGRSSHIQHFATDKLGNVYSYSSADAKWASGTLDVATGEYTYSANSTTDNRYFVYTGNPYIDSTTANNKLIELYKGVTFSIYTADASRYDEKESLWRWNTTNQGEVKYSLQEYIAGLEDGAAKDAAKALLAYSLDASAYYYSSVK